MAPERWHRTKAILEACLERKPQDRAAYLDQACPDDPALRAEIESLAASYDEGGELFEEPPLGREGPGLEGRRAGPYRIEREIGDGGMARVYLGVRADDAFRKQVAIKLVKRGMDYDFILRRFRHERQIMASLEHPNIARLLDGGSTAEGQPYFVMEYIEGHPIDEHCDQLRLPVRERLALFRTVCSAVQCAHEKLIVHRDIKPGNILITSDGIPKLLDFGIAKIFNPELATVNMDPTASALRLMTPEYASPEQVRGGLISPATDVYSLGVLLYQLLTGQRPYRLKSRAPHEMAQAICEIDPRKPSTALGRAEDAAAVSAARASDPDQLRRLLSGDLDKIVLKAMRKEPERRYTSAAEFAEDVQRYLDGRPVLARHGTLAYRAAKLLRRNKAAVAWSAASFAIAVLAAAGLATYRSRRPPVGPADIVPFTTFQGKETQPAFSPDGSKIAFVWTGEQGDNLDIYIKPLDGGGLQRLTTDPAEDVSPVWSPDGHRIAFLRTKGTETAVFVAPVAGGTHGKITEVYSNRVEALGRHLDWSPDGRFLAVADKLAPEDPFGIFLVRAATGEKHRLTLPPSRSIGDSGPAFSPDGKRISFLRAPSSGITELCVEELAGGEPRQLTHDSRSIASQSWTPDGRYLVFSSNRTGSSNLWRIPVSGGTPQRIPGVGSFASEPVFARDGRMAFAQSYVDANIWRLDLQAGTTRALISSTQYDSSPQYSADGARIAFRSSRSGNSEIWVCDREGRNARQLTHFGGPLTGTPRWSPGGRWVAFDSRPEGQADIYAIDPENGLIRRITSEPSEDVVPSWSRDGSWIYFASNRSGSWQVWKAPAEGGPKTQVTQGGGFAAFESPDGRYVYYAKGRSLPGLWRVPVNGGEEEPVLDGLKPGYWGYFAVAGDGIYFGGPEGPSRSTIEFFRLRDRRVRRLASLDKPLSVADSGFALAPDGRTLLYAQIDQSGSDIMIMEPGTRR